jgi:ABC-2 type transport system permease protein
MNVAVGKLKTNPFLGPLVALWWRDVIRFLRQRNRIIGALATPLVFWLLLGFGFTGSFQDPTAATNAAHAGSYLAYFFPGTIVLIMLFTAIFSTVSVIEDRREGFLQGVLVSPAARSALVWGKFLGGMTLAVLQGILFCALAPLAGWPLGLGNIGPILLSFMLTGLAMTGLGFLLAWPLDSTQGFHALMNVFLMPLWMLSGALFPVTPASGWVWWAYLLNPVSYSVTAVRQSLSLDPWTSAGSTAWVFSLSGSLFLTAGFAVALALISLRLVCGRRR